MAPGKVLVVQVNEPDVVISRVLETDVAYTQDELDALSERLTREYGGLTLHEVRRRLLAAVAREREEADRFVHRAAELGRRALEKKDSEEGLFFDGTARLLEKPEFADVLSLRRIFQAFDEKARVLDLVSRYLDSPGTSVVLGSEDDHVVGSETVGRLDLLRHGRDTDGNVGRHRTGAAGVHPRDSGRRAAGSRGFRPARPARGRANGEESE